MKDAARRDPTTRPSAAVRVVGRRPLIARVSRAIDAGHPVLLVGPPGVGKTTVLECVRRPDLLVIDPFERIDPRLAGRIRHRMDRGGLVAAACRTLDRRRLGSVGRILWRFVTVKVEPLARRDLRQVIRQRLSGAGVPPTACPPGWLDEAAGLARGVPRHGVALADAAGGFWRARGHLPACGWAFAEGLTAPLARSRARR